jgi:hypothetical protein
MYPRIVRSETSIVQGAQARRPQYATVRWPANTEGKFCQRELHPRKA